MGSGVALFDYDNDGRLDIFVVNGAPIRRQRELFRKNPAQNIGTAFSTKSRTAHLKTSPRKLALQARATAWESPWAITTMTDLKICT